MTARPEALAGFGVALYRLRAARRWSLRRAADAAGVSVTTVMRAEQGRSVGLAQAIGLAGAYGTTVSALLDGAAEGVREVLPDSPQPRLLHFAAEAHRRKWEFATDPAAFGALHRLGDEMLAAWRASA